MAYQPPSHGMAYPRSLCAAVLVALFVGRQGDLYVLLNRWVGFSDFDYACWPENRNINVLIELYAFRQSVCFTENLRW